MKLLLTTLNSKFTHSNLALKYLYSMVVNIDKPWVDLKEFTLNNERDYIYTEILEPVYDIVCFSCYIWNIEEIKDLCSNLKKAQPNIRILLGGPEVSYGCLEFMEENPWCNYILRGEGEESFKALCNLLSQVENISEMEEKLLYVEGFVVRKDGKILEGPESQLMDMAQLPFPYHKIPIEENKVVYYETARGCPFNCAYCLSSLDKTMRGFDLERVKRELDFFLEKKVKQVKLLDRTFNYDRDRAYEIWEYLIEKDNGKTNFHFEICGDLIREEDIKLLKKARPELFRFEIGIQTTFEDALISVGRQPKREKLFENIEKILRGENVEIHLDLIAGLPFETMETFRESFDGVYALKGHELQLGFLKLLRGTTLREDKDEYGFVYREKAPYEIISTSTMTAVDLVRLKKMERVVDVFFNRGGFENTINFLLTHEEMSPFDFYMGFSEYYHRRGFQHRYHKKEDNYRILYGYIDWMKGQYPDEEKALLEKDLIETMNFDAVKKFNKKGWLLDENN